MKYETHLQIAVVFVISGPAGTVAVQIASSLHSGVRVHRQWISILVVDLFLVQPVFEPEVFVAGGWLWWL